MKLSKLDQKRKPPRLLSVVRTKRVSKNLHRITLTGEDLFDFPLGRNGAHIKIFLPKEGQEKPILPTIGEQGIVWPSANIRPITRTYSVRRYNPLLNELDVDFVLHGDTCPASGWAKRATQGDVLGVAGPGGPDPLIHPADWHIIAGDMTALPAISALLEELPETAQGYAFIEISDKDDEQKLENNTSITLNWIYKGNQTQLAAIQAVNTPSSIKTVSAFVAGENSTVIAIRDYLREVFGLTKTHLYAVPYWRKGQDEEAYHQERHRVMDTVY